MVSNLSPAEFVAHSLELNMFFLRIMKEHAIFMEAGFPAKDKAFMERADRFKADFGNLLAEVIDMADGHIGPAVLNTHELVTPRTLDAERKTMELTGIPIDLELTAAELKLTPGNADPKMEEAMRALNDRAIALVKSAIDFQKAVLSDIEACQLFNWNFPSMLAHVTHEAEHYLEHLEQIQMGTVIDPLTTIVEEKAFWDQIMAEHGQFIAHYLDPVEVALIKKANRMAAVMMDLQKRATAMLDNRNSTELQKLLTEEIEAVTALRQFKKTGEDLILDCKLKSLISPLLADHVFREASHFLRTLEEVSMPRLGSKPKSAKAKSRAKLRPRRR